MVLFGGAGFGLSKLGKELFPQVDGGQFMVLVRAQPGTSLKASEVLVEKVEAEIRAEIGAWDTAGSSDPDSDLKLMISNIGVLYDWPAAYTPNAGPMDSFVLIQLKDTRKKTAPTRNIYIKSLSDFVRIQARVLRAFSGGWIIF